MTQQPPLNPHRDDGIDRRTLMHLLDRFLQVNRVRLDRALEALSPRQQIFLRALPVLLHANHPALPGYLGPHTPYGIRHYVPSPDALHATRQVSLAWRHDPHKPAVEPDLLSVFLMGSTGTVAQSGASDLDLWVCHARHLTPEAIAELQQKLSALEAWGASLNLEVHFFMMTDQHFRDARRDGLSGEDCGTTQHALLLDEFYRSALLLAGCTPLWWLIPTHEEHRYDELATMLVDLRFVDGKRFIDFGGIPAFPAAEFVGAGLWQLYKGISSPYKSVLKIVLNEVLAAQFPDSELLCHRYKRLIYAGQTSADELDPYVLMYRTIEEHFLNNDNPERLEFLRHCFYAKVNELLTRPSQSKHHSWRYQLMRRLATEWGWSDDVLRQLDNRPRWSADRVRQEYQELVFELGQSYRLLLGFARDRGIRPSIGEADIEVLGRKLHAAFERKSGKIDLINPGISDNLGEERVSLHLVRDADAQGANDHWALHRGTLKQHDAGLQEPLKRSTSLIEVLLWGVLNGILDNATRFTLDALESDLTELELQRILAHLRNAFSATHVSPDTDAYRNPATITQLMLFVNVGLDPLRDMTQRGLHYLSNRTDALNFSAHHHNLVLCIDEVRVNSWGEILCHQYVGRSALVHALRRYTQDILQGSPPHPVDVFCDCSTRAPAIVERVSQVVSDIGTWFRLGLPATHERQYLLEIETVRHVIGSNRGRAWTAHARNDVDLCRRISLNRHTYTHTHIDREAVTASPLRDILKLGRPGHIQLFFMLRGQYRDIYVHDECGRLVFCRRDISDGHIFLLPWLRFFNALYLRRQSSGEDLPESLANAHTYEVQRQGRQFTVERRKFGDLAPGQGWHDVHAMVERDHEGAIRYALFCDQREFSTDTHGPGMFTEAARYMVLRRRNSGRYPLYITDLDLSPLTRQRDIALSTADYLMHKIRLEDLLNSALEAL